MTNTRKCSTRYKKRGCDFAAGSCNEEDLNDMTRMETVCFRRSDARINSPTINGSPLETQMDNTNTQVGINKLSMNHFDFYSS